MPVRTLPGGRRESTLGDQLRLENRVAGTADTVVTPGRSYRHFMVSGKDGSTEQVGQAAVGLSGDCPYSTIVLV
jgi:hypothetical protein